MCKPLLAVPCKGMPPAKQPPTAPPHPLAEAQVPGAYTVTMIVQKTGQLMGALKRFQHDRQKAFEVGIRHEALHQDPRAGDEINNLVSREMGFEATFQAHQQSRVQNALATALAITDPAKRDAAVRQIFVNERRFTHQREMALRNRVINGTRQHHLRQSSPDGAYWRLGKGVKKHTLDCLAMANTHWPWAVLNGFSPPAHHGCACSLIATKSAIRRGLMKPDQVVNVNDAIRDAAARLTKAALAMRSGVNEADVESYVEGLELQEARYDRRFPKGTSHAGRFAPRVGGDPGAALLKKLGLRGRAMHELMPDRRPLALSTRGSWTWLDGKYIRVPHDHAWSRTVGGVKYASPAGTTNIHRDGDLISMPQGVPDERARDTIHVLADHVRASRREGVPRSAPLVAGDGPSAVLALSAKGYTPTAVRPVLGGHRMSWTHHDGSTLSAQLHPRGVMSADWDPAAIPEYKHETGGTGWLRHARDSKAFAKALGDQFGAKVRNGFIRPTGDILDHGGMHHWNGDIFVGSDTPGSFQVDDKARRANRPLSENELEQLHAAYHTTTHEVLHGINPISPQDYQGAEANLEEALTDMLAYPYSRERLRTDGHQDVVDWADRNPDSLSVRGTYRRARGGVNDALDYMGLDDHPQGKLRVLEELKFKTPPAERFARMGELIHEAHPELDSHYTEQLAHDLLLTGSDSLNSRTPAQEPSDPRPGTGTTPQWKRHQAGFYSLAGTRYAVMADGYEPVAERDREGAGVAAGITGREWAVIRYAEGEEHTGQGGENMDWFPTMREARAAAEDWHKRDQPPPQSPAIEVQGLVSGLHRVSVDGRPVGHISSRAASNYTAMDTQNRVISRGHPTIDAARDAILFRPQMPSEWSERGLAWNARWDALSDDAKVWLFHSTDKGTAAKMLADGIDPADKPRNLARRRYEAGEPATFSPGNGLGDGLTVGLHPYQTGGYGRQLLGVRVRKGDVAVSPEQANLGETSPGGALRVGDALVPVKIPAGDIAALGTEGKDPSAVDVAGQLRSKGLLSPTMFYDPLPDMGDEEVRISLADFLNGFEAPPRGGHDVPAARPGHAPPGVTYSPEVKQIKTAKDAQKALAGLGVKMALPDNRRALEPIKPDTLRDIVQAVKDTVGDYPELRTSDVPLDRILFTSSLKGNAAQQWREYGEAGEVSDAWAGTFVHHRSADELDTSKEGDPHGGWVQGVQILFNDMGGEFNDRDMVGSRQGLTSGAGVTVYGRVTHELGHAIAYANKLDTRDAATMDRYVDRLGDVDLGPRDMLTISEYAAGNPAEAWAEAFATLRVPEWLGQQSEGMQAKLKAYGKLVTGREVKPV